jgi:alpha,alpha-trehalose phosphorylase
MDAVVDAHGSATDLAPGLAAFIRKLRKQGVRTGLCHSDGKNARRLKPLKSADLFETIVASGDADQAGTDARGLVLAARQLGTHPFNCVVFTASNAGARAASHAGMKCVGVGGAGEADEAEDRIGKYAEVDITALIETGRTSTLEVRPWSVVETRPNPNRSTYWESIFALCNGYLGLRGTYEERYDKTHPGMFINRVFETEPLNMKFPQKDSPTYRTTMANLPDWRLMELEIDGEGLDQFQADVSEYSRELDLKRGTLTRSLVWQTTGGRRIRIRTTRLVSMVRRHSAAIRYQVTPLNFSGTVTLRSSIVDDATTGWIWRKCTRIVDSAEVNGNSHYSLIRIENSGQSIAMACGHVIGGTGRRDAVARSHTAGNTWSYTINLPVQKGRTTTVDKHMGFVTSWESTEQELPSASLAIVARDMTDGFPQLAREQKDFWARHWDIADVQIQGCPADQQALRFTMFQLRQNLPNDPLRSISATGLTGDHYFGMVFWDTEMFMCPYFLYTEPELAKSLLMYRCAHLGEARQRAAAMDGPGACFPWSTIDGLETNADTMVSYAQYHINCDIAYAIWRYWLATQDKAFLYEHGAEVVFETARFMANLGAFVPMKDNRFCINFVTGPDEYNYGVNNNCYTNGMTQFLFEFACSTYESMRKDRPDALAELCERIGLTADDTEQWRRCADNMYIPFNKDLGVHEQDDTYLYRDPVDVASYPQNYEIKQDLSFMGLGRMQVTKQADLILLMVTLGNRFSPETKRANYEFYEPRTTHASSLSPAVHSIAAAELGKNNQMYRFFRQSMYLDLYDFKGNTPEGVHFACAGGTWMAVVNGLAGLREYEDGISFAPRIPDAWQSYRFRLVLKGRHVQIRITQAAATFTLLKGRPLSFTVGGRTVRLTRQSPKARTPLAP